MENVDLLGFIIQPMQQNKAMLVSSQPSYNIMMIIKAVQNSTKLTRLFRFCSPPKSYVMPEKSETQLFYTPSKTMGFKDGRYLIYLNKQNLATPFLLGLHYTIPLSYLSYLMATNPFYLTFPAALPLMFITWSIILLRWLAHKAHHKKQVERIYLLNNGLQIEIFYSNKIRRMVKDNDMQTYHMIQQFHNIHVKDEQEERIKPIRGTRFPTDPNILLDQVEKPLLLHYGWTARDNDFNHFILPTKFDYADWEILPKVLNGIRINVTDENSSTEGLFHKKNYPSIEDEYDRIISNAPKVSQQNKDSA